MSLQLAGQLATELLPLGPEPTSKHGRNLVSVFNDIDWSPTVQAP